MPLVTDDGIVADSYRRRDDDGAAPDLIVPLSDVEAHAGHGGRLGVDVSNDARLADIAPHLGRLDLVCLPFPAFTDGRAYSLARQIRQAGFSGQLRATGNVLPDQIQFMAQVGFDAFEVADRFASQVWLAALSRLTLSYQAESGGARHVWQQRAREAGGQGLRAAAR